MYIYVQDEILYVSMPIKLATSLVPGLVPNKCMIFPIKATNLFKFSAQGSDLAPFVGNLTKVKIPSEIEPPLC